MSNMALDMTWSRNFTKIFISEYKKLPCLWNTKIKEYNGKYLKQQAYESLRQMVLSSKIHETVTIYDIKRKINSLRSSFRKEHAKVIKSNMAYTPKLWSYQYLLFVANHDLSRFIPASNNIPDSNDDYYVNYDNLNNDKREEHVQLHEHSAMIRENISENFFSESMQSNSSVINVKEEIDEETEFNNQAQKDSVTSSHITDPLDRVPVSTSKARISTEISARNHSDPLSLSRSDMYDEDDIFGVNVAMKLRRISDSHQKILCERIINEAMFQAQLGQLSVKSSIVS